MYPMKKSIFHFYLIVLVIIIVVSSGCERFRSEKFVNDTPFTIMASEPIDIDNDLSFSIEKISDSRCPKGAYCFWAGNVVLSFRINHNSSQTDTLICDTACGNNPFNLYGYSWKILEVTPYPELQNGIDQADYKIRLQITRN